MSMFRRKLELPLKEERYVLGLVKHLESSKHKMRPRPNSLNLFASEVPPWQLHEELQRMKSNSLKKRASTRVLLSGLKKGNNSRETLKLRMQRLCSNEK